MAEREKRKTEVSSADDATAAAAAAPLRGRSSLARPLLSSSSSSSVLAWAGFIVAEVVRHLHRVHQRGAAAVFFVFGFIRERVFFFFRGVRSVFLSLSRLFFLFSLFSSSRFQKKSNPSYLHLAIASVLRTYFPELRIPRRWSEDCEKIVLRELSLLLSVGVERNRAVDRN